ncbi:hypothetical protein RUND412_010346 [Rhizina undulata]
MAPIGIAILGSGIFVQKEHKPAVEACKDVELKAVYSRGRKSAEMLFGSSNVDIYSDDSVEGKHLDALLARQDIQAVVIALPIPIQPAIIKKSLLAGKHVLSEKPVAKDLSDAAELIAWKAANAPTLNWAVAENFRYQETFEYARSVLAGFGKILGFNVQTSTLVLPGSNYYETEWRKTPEHQGGFILDGGVHYTAALQYLLGEEKIKQVSAFTALAQKHLSPVDTVNAVVKTESGVVGFFALSWGTTLKQFEFTVAAEGGSVTVGFSDVIVRTRKPDGSLQEDTKDFGITGERSGVKAEVRAFAEAIAKGVWDERQSPELATKDLELIEKMLLSGERGGETLDIKGGF